jgi:hypothetical protein
MSAVVDIERLSQVFAIREKIAVDFEFEEEDHKDLDWSKLEKDFLDDFHDQSFSEFVEITGDDSVWMTFYMEAEIYNKPYFLAALAWVEAYQQVINLNIVR